MVASQDWPEVTKYAGLVSAQAHRQELIQDLFKTWQDPARGTMTGGMIKYAIIFPFYLSVSYICRLGYFHNFWVLIVQFYDRELLISFRRATGQKPQRIIFYRYSGYCLY